MERTGDTFDNWQIIALKTLWYDPMHCEDRIRVEERASMDYYRSIGTPLLNHNSPIDTNDGRRTYMEAWQVLLGNKLQCQAVLLACLHAELRAPVLRGNVHQCPAVLLACLRAELRAPVLIGDLHDFIHGLFYRSSRHKRRFVHICT